MLSSLKSAFCHRASGFANGREERVERERKEERNNLWSYAVVIESDKFHSLSLTNVRYTGYLPAFYLQAGRSKKLNLWYWIFVYTTHKVRKRGPGTATALCVLQEENKNRRRIKQHTHNNSKCIFCCCEIWIHVVALNITYNMNSMRTMTMVLNQATPYKLINNCNILLVFYIFFPLHKNTFSSSRCYLPKKK